MRQDVGRLKAVDQRQRRLRGVILSHLRQIALVVFFKGLIQHVVVMPQSLGGRGTLEGRGNWTCHAVINQ